MYAGYDIVEYIALAESRSEQLCTFAADIGAS